MRPTDTKQPFLDFRGIPKVPGKNESSLEEGKKSAPKQKKSEFKAKKSILFAPEQKKTMKKIRSRKKSGRFRNFFLQLLEFNRNNFSFNHL